MHTTPKKIGIDARLWSQTGVGRYIRNLISQLLILDKVNEYILFINSKDKDSVIQIVKNWQIVTVDIPWHSLQEQLFFPGILNKYDLDLVHFPYFSMPVLYNGAYVVTIHDLINDHYATGKITTLAPFAFKLKYLGYRFIMRKSALNAKCIFAPSIATKKEIISHYHTNEKKIIVTPEGIDDKVKSKEAVTSLKLPDTYLLYVGNVYPHKNADALLDAFLLVLEKHPECKLVFVGKTDYFYIRLNERVNRLNIENFVIFTGFVDDTELSGYYRHAKSVVIPSYMEGFGLPALEAMANNCPVLASNIPSLIEVCGKDALYFDPHDIYDMADKISAVLEKPSVRSELIRAYPSKIKKYSWKILAEATLAVYNTC